MLSSRVKRMLKKNAKLLKTIFVGKLKRHVIPMNE